MIILNQIKEIINYIIMYFICLLSVNLVKYVFTGWAIKHLEFESDIKKICEYFFKSMVLLGRLNLSI